MKIVFVLVWLFFGYSDGGLVKDEYEVEVELRFVEDPDHGATRVRREALADLYRIWKEKQDSGSEGNDADETTTTTTTTTTEARKYGKGAKQVELSIHMPDKSERKMMLEKRKKFDVPISSHTIRGGQLVQDPTPTHEVELNLFGSDEEDTFLLMRCDNSECTTMGSLYNGTEIYTIESTAAEPYKGKGKVLSVKAQPRMADEKIMGIASDGSPLPVPTARRKKRDLYLTQTMKNSMRSRRKRQTSTGMVVELIIIADYSEYLYWLQRAKNNEEEAKQIMQMYYVLLTNMMDLRFQDLAAQKGDSVTFMINDIIYCETEADCPWMEGNVIGNVVDVNKALDDVTKWAWSLRGSMKPHDHIMVVSKKDLGAVFDGEMRSDPIGVAWTGGMCNSGYSISIIEDPGLGLIDYAATHEIGHSMSSHHDTAWGCSDEDFYIMGGVGGGPSVGLSTLNKSSNPFLFSSCAANAMHNFLTGLGSGNCLLNNNFDTAAYNQYKSFFAPGVFLPIDTQCELHYGGGSRRCFAIEPSICSDGAWCWNPADPNYCYSLYVREGTLCAENQRCHRGVCVDSNIVAPTCPPGVYSSEGLANEGGVIVDSGATAEGFTVTVAPSSGTSYATFESVSAQEIPSADVIC